MTERFVLCGFPRTGTTVVAGSIVQHPELLFYGEIFNNMGQVRQMEARRITMGAGWKFERPLDFGVDACALNCSARSYLDAFFERQGPHKAVGFKLMLDQVREGPNSDIWPWLADNSDVRIIRTRRDNLLESVCSYVRASMTRRWHSEASGDQPKHRFVVPPADVEALFKRFEDLAPEWQSIEQTHQILDLDYQRISSDFSGCMDDVHAFLGVSPRKVEPRLKKIASMTPKQELANYDDLKATFADSHYGRYFTE